MSTPYESLVAPVRAGSGVPALRLGLWWGAIGICPALFLSALLLNEEPLGGLLDEIVCLAAALTFVGWRIRQSAFAQAVWITSSCLVLAAIGVSSALINPELGSFPRLPAALVTIFADMKILLLGFGLAFFATPALRERGGGTYPRQFLFMVASLQSCRCSTSRSRCRICSVTARVFLAEDW